MPRTSSYRSLRRARTCQKRLPVGAKETYYKCQKRLPVGAKETYYKCQKRLPVGAKETYIWGLLRACLRLVGREGVPQKCHKRDLIQTYIWGLLRACLRLVGREGVLLLRWRRETRCWLARKLSKVSMRMRDLYIPTLLVLA